MTINMTKNTTSKVAWVEQVPDKFTKDSQTASGGGKKSNQDIKEFAESTSAHGLKNAVSERGSRFRR